MRAACVVSQRQRVLGPRAAQVLGKSCKMVPVMIGGIILGGKWQEYKIIDYIQARARRRAADRACLRLPARHVSQRAQHLAQVLTRALARTRARFLFPLSWVAHKLMTRTRMELCFALRAGWSSRHRGQAARHGNPAGLGRRKA